MSKQLFFIALLPPIEIQEQVTTIKQYFAEVYDSKAALKSPPHITLQPPFNWEVERLGELKAILERFVRKQVAFSVNLDGFAVFAPRVIYVDVEHTESLLNIQKALMNELESELGIVHRVAKTRPFTPHMTVGFKDLSKENFQRAWAEFETKEFRADFQASGLTLHQFDQIEQKKWLVEAALPFSE